MCITNSVTGQRDKSYFTLLYLEIKNSQRDSWKNVVGQKAANFSINNIDATIQDKLKHFHQMIKELIRIQVFSSG